MGVIWEIDFYSRPLVDEQQKKVWELLICESPSNTQQSTAELFRYSKYCPSDRVNSAWLGEALQAAMVEAQESPQRIRFFRRQMNNMITKACKDIGIPSAASRRSIALQQWLAQRMEEVYPQDPNYKTTNTPSVQMFSDPPQLTSQSICGYAGLANWIWRIIPSRYGWRDSRNGDSWLTNLLPTLGTDGSMDVWIRNCLSPLPACTQINSITRNWRE
jgi:RNA-binding protein Tab2/Atab2